jgi:hypothetical protein
MVRDALNHLEGGHHALARVREIEHLAVAEPLHRLSTVLLRRPPDERGHPLGQVRRGLVPPLFGQARVTADVEEADRLRTMQPTVQAGLLESDLDVLESALAPGVFLLRVVHGEEGLLGEGCYLGPEIGLGIQHLSLRHPPLDEGHLDVCSPPVGLRLDDPAQTVGADS